MWSVDSQTISATIRPHCAIAPDRQSTLAGIELQAVYSACVDCYRQLQRLSIGLMPLWWHGLCVGDLLSNEEDSERRLSMVSFIAEFVALIGA